MNKSLPLTAVCPAMVDLVATQGWSLLHSGGDPGYSATAAIQKDGVIFRYSSIKGDRDYDVELAIPVHPDLSLEFYLPPSLPALLDDIGLRYVDPEKVFSTAAENLSRVKNYLSDAAVWERNVNTAIASLADKYVCWSDGPQITRDRAKSLATRHPWLLTGILPTAAGLRKGRLVPNTRAGHLKSGIVWGAVGIGLIIVRYLS